MTDFWMIRAGKNGIYVHDFLGSGIVAIECSNLGIITNNVSQDEIARRYIEANHPATKIQARNTVSQIDRFVHSISIGDFALTYESKKRIYYLGTIESDIFWNPNLISNLPCIRYVKWTKEISRDDINSKFISSLGALLTVFKVKPETSGNILNNARPIFSPTTKSASSGRNCNEKMPVLRRRDPR